MSDPSPSESQVQQPGSRVESRSWLGQSLLIIFLPLIVLGAVYFFYVVHQQALQSRYLFQVLSKSAEDVAQAIVTRRSNIREVIEGVDPSGNISDLEGHVKDKLSLIPGIESDNIKFKPDLLQGAFCGDVDTDVKMRIDSGMQSIEFRVMSGPEATDPFMTIEQSLKELLLPWISVEGLLESMLVADGDGDVFLNKGLRSIALVDLQVELQQQPAASEINTARDVDKSSAASIWDVELAGEPYKLFLRPFRVSGVIDAAEGETVWVIGGLVSNTAFRTRTMAVPPTLVMLVFTSVVILLLMVPYLRVRFIGKREGLDARDVFLLALTMLAGCSLASLAATHTWAYWEERQTRDEELEALAKVINGRVTEELNELENGLIGAVRHFPATADGKTRTKMLADPRWQPYPHFEMVFGIGKDGEQKWKGSIKSTATPLIQLKDRKYFQRARDDHLWPPSAGPVEGSLRGDVRTGRFVESIRSKTTGEEYAILSGRLGRIQPAKEGMPQVAAIESRLLSLIDPVLLPPYQFCVIDSDGIVQFHSNRHRNLTENLFEALGSNWEVKAAVRRRASRHFSATYRADPIAGYITTLQETPWMLVVFSDRRDLGYMGLETLTISLVVVVLYLTLLIIGGGGLVFLIFRIVALFRHVRSPAGAAHSMWHWPNPDGSHHRLYVLLLFLILVTFVVWSVGMLEGQWWMPICWFFGPIVAFVLVGGIIIRFGRSQLLSSRPADPPSSWPWPYGLVVVGILMSVGVLPPVTFYAATNNAERAAFEDRRQLALAHSLRARVQRHVARFREVPLNQASAERIRRELKLEEGGTNRLIENAFDVHLPRARRQVWHVNETSKAVDAPSRSVWPERLRAWLAETAELVEYRYGMTFGRVVPSPNFNEYASESRGMVLRNSKQLIWSPPELFVLNWRSSVLPLGLGGADNHSGRRHQIHLSVRGSRVFEADWGAEYVVIAAVVTVAITILLFACQILPMVFVRDLKYPRWIAGQDLLGHQPELRRQLRLRFPSKPDSEKENPRRYTVDFRHVMEATSGADLVQQTEQALNEKSEVYLTQFDYGLTDPEIRGKKLELLEYLVSRNNRVVIESSIDPMFFLTVQAHDRWAGTTAGISLARWAAALQHFATLRAKKDEKELRERLAKKMTAEESVWPHLSQEIRETLVSEGWFSEFLGTVATTLCRRPEVRDYKLDDVIEQFEDAAGAHYRRIWSTFSTDEKVLLRRLAQGAFVNWKMKDTVTSLMRRRIIVVAPDFRLMNESFRRFVLRAEPAHLIRRWEDEAEPSTWKRIRVPLFVLLLFVASFFVVTQRDLFVQMLSVLTMLTAGAPALLKLASLVMQGRPSASP